jgi:PKD repeat protein
VTNAADSSSVSGIITVAPVAPVAAFTTTPGPDPLTVTFTSTSATPATGPLSYAWAFGDGITSADPAPSHTYATAETFPVTLTVTNSVGATSTITIPVTVAPVAPVAAFTTTPGPGPLTVTFTSTSETPATGTLTYAWAFGDTTTSDLPGPTHTYAAAGPYTVILTVTNSAGATSTITVPITVEPIPPVAAFTPTTPLSGPAPLSVTFASTSATTATGTLTYSWDVNNDGSVDSIAQSFTYVYTTPGPYTVTLTVANSAGSDTTTGTITVYGPPVAAFTSTVTGLSVEFSSLTSTGTPPLSYLWDFGDKSGSTEANPVHTYAAADTYHVTLTVSNLAGPSVPAATAYVTVTQQPITPITLPSASDIPATVDTDKYSLITTIKATGGAPPYIYSVKGDLPSGLVLDPAKGIVSSGTPSAADIGKTFIFTIIATDKEKNSVSQTYTITVTAPSAPEIPGGDDSGPAAGQDAVAQSIESQSLESLGIDLSVNGVSIATGATVTVNGNVVTITTPTFTVVYVSGKITEIQGMLISQDAGSISLSTESVEASIPGVGEVSGSVEAGIDSISDGAEVNLTLAKPEVKDILAFEAAMKKEGKELDAVAFTMTVTKTNITANLPAKITMTVPPDWVARNGGITAVSIVRTADDGTTQVLPTTFAGIDFKTGNFVFEALSKDGLSVFGLVTAKATVVEKEENPNTTVVVASKSIVSTDVGMYAWMISELEQNPVILVILLAVVALVAYFGWWKRRL